MKVDLTLEELTDLRLSAEHEAHRLLLDLRWWQDRDHEQEDIDAQAAWELETRLRRERLLELARKLLEREVKHVILMESCQRALARA